MSKKPVCDSRPPGLQGSRSPARESSLSAEKPRGGTRGRKWTEGDAFVLLAQTGIDAICNGITSGLSMRKISEQVGVTKNALWRWLAADIDRSARARAARALTAWHWDEQAAELISSADNGLELGKARELAFHYRWRASKIAPKEYGDRVNLDHGGSVTLETLVTQSLKGPAAPV
jgi:hypothetical protein